MKKLMFLMISIVAINTSFAQSTPVVCLDSSGVNRVSECEVNESTYACTVGLTQIVIQKSSLEESKIANIVIEDTKDCASNRPDAFTYAIKCLLNKEETLDVECKITK